jgi:hypothetical protein
MLSRGFEIWEIDTGALILRRAAIEGEEKSGHSNSSAEESSY